MTNVMCESLYDLLRRVSAVVPGPTIYVTHHSDDAAQSGGVGDEARGWQTHFA